MKVLFFIGTLLIFNLGFGQTEVENKKPTQKAQLRAGNITLNDYSSHPWTFSKSQFLQTDSLEIICYPALASENVIMGKVLSYDFTLVDSNGVQKVSVPGNNLTAVKNLINTTKPGSFVMFSKIKVSLYDKVFYIQNYTSNVVE